MFVLTDACAARTGETNMSARGDTARTPRTDGVAADGRHGKVSEGIVAYTRQNTPRYV